MGRNNAYARNAYSRLRSKSLIPAYQSVQFSLIASNDEERRNDKPASISIKVLYKGCMQYVPSNYHHKLGMMGF